MVLTIFLAKLLLCYLAVKVAIIHHKLPADGPAVRAQPYGFVVGGCRLVEPNKAMLRSLSPQLFPNCANIVPQSLYELK